MTYGEAVESALRTLQMGATSYAHEQYDDILLQYANAAVLELSKDSRPVAEETVAVADGSFLFSDLQYAIHALIEVRDANNKILHTKADGDRVTVCRQESGTVKVLYEYYPDYVGTDAMAETAIPLPRQYHRLVPTFISAQYLLSDASDKVGFSRGQSLMQIFSAQRRNLHKPENGSTRSYKLRNRGW